MARQHYNRYVRRVAYYDRYRIGAFKRSRGRKVKARKTATTNRATPRRDDEDLLYEEMLDEVETEERRPTAPHA